MAHFLQLKTPAAHHQMKMLYTLRLLIQCIMTMSNLFIIAQCETWACLVEHKADILAGIEERPTRSSSSSALSLSLLFVFCFYSRHA